MSTYKEAMGEISVYRSELFSVLSQLPSDRLDILQDTLAGTICDLRRLWGTSLSAHQQGTLNALEIIEFRIRHRDKFTNRDETGGDKPYFLCRKCESAIIIHDFATDSCPACGTGLWLELVHT